MPILPKLKPDAARATTNHAEIMPFLLAPLTAAPLQARSKQPVCGSIFSANVAMPSSTICVTLPKSWQWHTRGSPDMKLVVIDEVSQNLTIVVAALAEIFEPVSSVWRKPSFQLTRLRTKSKRLTPLFWRPSPNLIPWSALHVSMPRSCLSQPRWRGTHYSLADTSCWMGGFVDSSSDGLQGDTKKTPKTLLAKPLVRKICHLSNLKPHDPLL